MTAVELLTHAAELRGMDSRILRYMLCNARWGKDRLAAEIETPDWFERLESELIEIAAENR